MGTLLKKRLGEKGATAIEYAMVAFFISIAAFSVLVTVGSSVSSAFQNVANAM
ncbi:MAG TPA: Flp family type IVb pilin [Stellaceae bacterium]|nr:Flp family type IVb pilin [Stellaceae bacterium]